MNRWTQCPLTLNIKMWPQFLHYTKIISLWSWCKYWQLSFIGITESHFNFRTKVSLYLLAIISPPFNSLYLYRIKQPKNQFSNKLKCFCHAKSPHVLNFLLSRKHQSKETFPSELSGKLAEVQFTTWWDVIIQFAHIRVAYVFSRLSARAN